MDTLKIDRRYVNDRLTAERELRESESRFRSLTNLSADWYWEQDEEYRFVRFSGGDRDGGWGRKQFAVLGLRRWDRPGALPVSGSWSEHKAVLEARKPFRNFEYQHILEDGTLQYVAVSGEPVFDASGRFTGYRGVATDITERKREDLLRGLEHAVAMCLGAAQTEADGLNAVMRAVCTAMTWQIARYWRADDEAGVLRFGDSWTVPDLDGDRVTAISRDVVFARGSGLAGRVWETGEPIWVANVSNDPRVLRTDLARDAGMRGAFLIPATAEGKTMGVLAFSSREVREPDTRLLHAIRAIGSQVGQFLRRKQAEAVLRDTEERYRKLVDTSPDAMLIHSEGRITFVNQAMIALMGARSAAELVGKPSTFMLAPEYEELARQRIRGLYSGRAQPHTEQVYIRLDGTPVNVESAAAPLVIDDKPAAQVTVRDITERKRTEEELRRFRAAMDISGDAILLVDRTSLRYLDVNQTFCDLVGYTRKEMLGMTPMDLFSADRETLERDYDAIIADGNCAASRIEGQYRRKDGSLIPIETRRRALRTPEGWIIVAIARDISERRKADEKIRRLNRVRAVLSNINALIMRANDRDQLYREVCRIARDPGGFPIVWIGEVDREAMQVKPVAAQGTDERFFGQIRMTVREDAPEGLGVVGQAVRDRRPVISNDVASDPRITGKGSIDGDSHSLVVLPLVVAAEVKGVLVLHSDAVGFFDEEEMKLLTESAGDIAFALDHIEKGSKLDYLAYFDSLTGLANRTLFLDRLNQSIHAAGLAGDKAAVLLVDVERFGMVNESLGRQGGDALLKQLAERLAHRVGQGDVARINADNFAVVLQGIKGKSEVTRRVERMWHDCFSKTFRLGESDIRISAKAGVALFPNDGTDAETLVRNAEAALRRAKRTGERQVFHALEMTAKTGEKLTLENSLRQALEKNEFVLHYQPKVDLTTSRIVGVEALIRWQSPELGLVPPMKFIPLMEETGLILDVGAWALDKAIEDHLRWMKLGVPAPRVAVNVSAIQLRRRDFVFIVEDALTRGATPPGIDLEITESLVMEDIQGNIEKLKAIQALGLSIAIDDFGTGYSSLGYLAKLPLQTLKIDRSFVITMLKDSDTMTLVQTIISLAHSLRLKVVAEGVDKEEQAKMLRLLRCDEMQGYLFSRPIPFEQMTTMLTQGSSAKWTQVT